MSTRPPSLLRAYLNHGTEAAFASLVREYIDIVYSAARRVVAGDTHLAEDVTQTVFADLARKARSLPEDTMLSAWLYRHTFFVASSMIRTEQRRRRREQESFAMNRESDVPRADWSQLEPHLDRTLNELSEPDRLALVLRFFEQLDLRAVGERLGVGEDAAQKRVQRALEKLRSKFSKRGLRLPVSGIAAALLANAITSAPTSLAAQTATAVVAGTAAGTGILFTVQQILSMNAIKPILGVLCAAGVAVPMVMQHQTVNTLRDENAALLEKSSRLDEALAENERLAALKTDHAELEALRKEHLDLLRLRGEWTQMRDKIAELNAEVERQQQLLAAKSAAEEEENKIAEEERERNRQVDIRSQIVELPVSSDIWREFGLGKPSHGGAQTMGILTPDQMEALRKRLEQDDNARVVASPRVVTSNGRQTQIASVSPKRFVTDSSNGIATSEEQNFGTTLDLVPTFDEGSDSLKLAMHAQLRELKGADELGAGAEDLPPEFRSLPIVETREMENEARILSGQTVVLSGGYSESGGVPTGLMILITPTEVDEVGNLRSHEKPAS